MTTQTEPDGNSFTRAVAAVRAGGDPDEAARWLLERLTGPSGSACSTATSRSGPGCRT